MGWSITVQIVTVYSQKVISNLWQLEFLFGKKNVIFFGRNHTISEQYDDDEALDCGKPVNFTYYDNLVGVLNRYRHPIVPEPQVALIFTKSKKNSKGQLEFDINALERKLKRAKREVRF